MHNLSSHVEARSLSKSSVHFRYDNFDTFLATYAFDLTK